MPMPPHVAAPRPARPRKPFIALALAALSAALIGTSLMLPWFRLPRVDVTVTPRLVTQCRTVDGQETCASEALRTMAGADERTFAIAGALTFAAGVAAVVMLALAIGLGLTAKAPRVAAGVSYAAAGLAAVVALAGLGFLILVPERRMFTVGAGFFVCASGGLTGIGAGLKLAAATRSRRW